MIPLGGSGFLNVGSGDFGVLNYAFGLEQLEAAFCTQVAAGAYFAGASAAERAIFPDLKDHKVIHRNFFRKINNAIKDLTLDFSGIGFSVRAATAGSAKLSVLDAAGAFEDLGITAYNGANHSVASVDYLTLAGKIASVEVRHAAAIRKLLATNTLVASDVVDTATTGLEKSKRPRDVLATANTFLAAGSKLSSNSFT